MVTCIAQIVDADLQVQFAVQDGDAVTQNQRIGQVEGRIHSILMAERLMLNCMQRMSGIATKVHHLKTMIAAYPAKILDTRKTTPNFRMAEKWAVRIGGGVNHRFGLYDMILIKDNHIKAAGGVTSALEATQQYCTKEKVHLPVVVEVKNQAELEEALEFDFVSRILLDNMTPATVEEMILINQQRKPLEVSGGIHQDNIVAYAATGVDFISIGDLTHHIESVDISLKII
jgi:nicotinate-nucleotide pyrophosphorylase (carboxylating)